MSRKYCQIVAFYLKKFCFLEMLLFNFCVLMSVFREIMGNLGSAENIGNATPEEDARLP